MFIVLKLSELISMIPFSTQMDNAKAYILCDTTQMPVQLYLELNQHHIQSEFILSDTDNLFLQGILVGTVASKAAENEDVYIVTSDTDMKNTGLPGNYHITSAANLFKIPKKKPAANKTKTVNASVPKAASAPSKSKKVQTETDESFMNKPEVIDKPDAKPAKGAKRKASKTEKQAYSFDSLASAVSNGDMKANAPKKFKDILEEAGIGTEIKSKNLKVDETYDKIYYAVYESDTNIVLSMRMRINLPEPAGFANSLAEKISPLYERLRQSL